jgi:hypothetical protein
MIGYTKIESEQLPILYAITIEGSCFIDSTIAMKLELSLKQYTDILIKCNAVEIDKEHGYYFRNPEDAENALVMLKLMTGA